MADGKHYQVTAEYVTVKTMTVQGVRVVGLHKDAPVPADVPEEDLAHLIKMGLIHEIGWQPPTMAEMNAEQQAQYQGAILANAEAELAKAQKARDEAKLSLSMLHQAQKEAAAASQPDAGDSDGSSETDSSDGGDDSAATGSEPGKPAGTSARSRAGAKRG